MSNMPKVVVAMSGGVDSSVVAALLVEQGYSVTGMMLRLWSEDGCEDANRCCTPDAMAQARKMAGQLGIPFYVIDAKQTFRQTVVQAFLDGYTAGVTPNPCITCNRQVRWGLLWERAKALGAEYMATGHYARLERAEDGQVSLLRALDEHKDQSYVLSGLSREQLAHSMFPLGGYTKPEVRELAHRFNLSAAERPDSQDLCFLAGQDYRDFLRRHAPETHRPGLIRSVQGEVLGEHQGLANYTIGQRKGLGVTASRPLYVIQKKAVTNELIVGYEEDLGSRCFMAGPMNWIAAKPLLEPMELQVKIRYKAPLAEAVLFPPEQEGEPARVETRHPLRDITPGQLAVFYQDERVLGSGLILST